jgi:hypothetical protein
MGLKWMTPHLIAEEVVSHAEIMEGGIAIIK